MSESSNEPYVTAMRIRFGWFAVEMRWTVDRYQIWEVGSTAHPSQAEAQDEARQRAAAEGIQYLDAPASPEAAT